MNSAMNARGYTKILSGKMAPIPQILSREGIPQYVNNPSPTGRITQRYLKTKEPAKYVTLLEPNRTPFGVFFDHK